MAYACKVVERSEQPTLSVRTTTSVDQLPRVLGQAYGTIMQHLQSLGEQPSSCPPFVAYYNMDMQNLDVEAGYGVSGSLPGKETVQPSTIPAGRYASCVHVGPYSTVGPAYNALTQWIQENGYHPTGVAYEYYLNDPAVTPEEELETRIEFLLT